MGTWAALFIVSEGLIWRVGPCNGGHPSGLGLEWARLIPRGRDAALQWVLEVKEDLRQCAKGQKSSESSIWYQQLREEWPYPTVQRHCGPTHGLGILKPSHNLDINYEYMIHLDLLYFGLDGLPILDLLCMPSTSSSPPDSDRGTDFVLLLDNSRNVFWHPSCSLDAQAECRFNFDQGDYPAPKVDALHLQDSCPGSAEVSVAALLDPYRWASSDEAVRAGLLESFVCMFMTSREFYRMLRLAQMRQEMDSRCWRYCAERIMQVASRDTYNFDDEQSSWSYVPPPIRFDPDWPRENVCVHCARFLEEPSHLDDAIARVVQLARTRHSSGLLWGVVFSGMHCAIVRIDATVGRPCTHTPALSFLPDWDDTELRTEGVIALAQLFHVPASPPSLPVKALPQSALARLPPEVIQILANVVDSSTDLWSLAHAVPGLVSAMGIRVRRGAYLDDLRILVQMESNRPTEIHSFICLDKEGVYTERSLVVHQRGLWKPPVEGTLSAYAPVMTINTAGRIGSLGSAELISGDRTKVFVSL